MALRALQGPTGGGSPVGGTGTTNTIPRWTGPSTLGDSGLIDNGTAVYTTTRNVGIGTANPLWKNHTVGAGLLLSGTAFNLAAVNQDQTTYRGVSLGYDTSGQIGVIASTGASSSLAFWTNNAGTWGERARIDSAGNFGIGTGAATTTPAATGSLVIGQNNVSQQWAARIYGGNDANRAPVLSLFRAGNTEGIIAEIKNGAVGALALGITGGVANFNDATLSAACQVQITSTLMDISGSGYGLKLPATPGNADTQTLDCYQENYASNSWTPVIFGGTTAGTATYSVQEGFYTRWGNLIFCTATVVFSGHTGTGNLSLSGLPFAAKTAGSGTYRSSIIIEEGGGVKAILRLQSGTTATTTGVSIAASGNYVISFVYATN